MTAILNKPAPQPAIGCWVQGTEPPITELIGNVILIEIIQVNCPGCFIHALPEVIRLHKKYTGLGLKIFAIATAFEHFEQNTLHNLRRLLQHGELQGAPLQQLGRAGFLENNALPYDIPFSVAMDKLVKRKTTSGNDAIIDEEVDQFILSQIPDFHQGALSSERKQAIIQQAKSHLNDKTYNALTFEMYQLQGTPSSIVIDKKGILRHVLFANINSLEPIVRRLL
jgi:hypothetical protein